MQVKLCRSEPPCCVHRYKHIHGRKQLYSVMLVLKSVCYNQSIHTLTCPEIVSFISLIFCKHYLLEREAILVQMKTPVLMYLSFKFLHVTTKLKSGLQRMLVKLCRSDALCCGRRRKHIYIRQQLHSVMLLLKSV